MDWLETGEDTEKKLVWKKFDTGELQLWLVSKIIIDGKRTADKKMIDDNSYHTMFSSATLCLEKKRFEFNFIQNGTTFSMKYDEFNDSLRMLEVDADTEELRNSFDPTSFPHSLLEVTGDLHYYGHRMAKAIE